MTSALPCKARISLYCQTCYPVCMASEYPLSLKTQRRSRTGWEQRDAEWPCSVLYLQHWASIMYMAGVPNWSLLERVIKIGSRSSVFMGLVNQWSSTWLKCMRPWNVFPVKHTYTPMPPHTHTHKSIHTHMYTHTYTHVHAHIFQREVGDKQQVEILSMLDYKTTKNFLFCWRPTLLILPRKSHLSFLFEVGWSWKNLSTSSINRNIGVDATRHCLLRHLGWCP